MTEVYRDSQGNIVVDLSGAEKTAEMTKERKHRTTYGGIDLSSGFPAELIWITRDGRRIAIPNMTDSHLLNTLAFLRRNVLRYKRQIIRARLTNLAAIHMMMDNIWGTSSQDMQEELDKASNDSLKLMDMSDDEFLLKYVPKWNNLYKEAYERKLIIEVDATKITGTGAING